MTVLLLLACDRFPDPTEGRECGIRFSRECRVTPTGCVEPVAHRCSGSASLESVQRSVDDLVLPELGSPSVECTPTLLAFCDDPDYFVHSSFGLYGSASSGVYHVDGTCVGSFIWGDDNPAGGNICFQLEPLYTGPPELEACARRIFEPWVTVEGCGGMGTPCPEGCVVDETR
ncbi:MAG: hypothetical protein KC656_31615 [Myxococcales bacterium]|nr:hypothetical protein [Myxococcales bacterium]